MTDPTVALMALLRKHNLDMDGAFLREAVQLLMQRLIELEASEQIGAARYERTANRQTHRSGYRPRSWETRVGEVPLRIPKLRQLYESDINDVTQPTTLRLALVR